MNSIQARSWVDLGISIIPVRPRSKVPLIPWKEYSNRFPTHTELEQWFSPAKRNMGIICGPISGNLVVLDFDHGFPQFIKWRVSHPAIRDTYAVKTARGVHAYLHCDNIPPKTLDYPNLDVKCSGYVLAAGSIHPSGTEYTEIGTRDILHIASVDEALGKEYVECKTDASRDIVIETPLRQSSVRTNSGIVQDIKCAVSVLELANHYTAMYPTSMDGKWWMGICPAHRDSNPSLRVDAKNDIAYCWSPKCSLHDPRGADQIRFYAAIKGISNSDAIHELAIELGIIV